MIKVIKTLIYGVKPSGNQAERAIRQTAEKNRDEYTIACDIVQNDIYVDDCISGTTSEGEGVLAIGVNALLGERRVYLKRFFLFG